MTAVEGPSSELTEDQRTRMLNRGLAVFKLEHERSPASRRYFALCRSVAQPVGVSLVVLVYLAWGLLNYFAV